MSLDEFLTSILSLDWDALVSNFFGVRARAANLLAGLSFEGGGSGGGGGEVYSSGVGHFGVVMWIVPGWVRGEKKCWSVCPGRKHRTGKESWEIRV